MKSTESSLLLSDYQYTLPEEKIAKFPLDKREASKLLLFDQGKICHRKFIDLPKLLPNDTTLVFNNTKVIPARLIFQKKTGATIEVFLLQPVLPSTSISQVMAAKNKVVWETMIGNLKRWKEGESISKQLTIGIKRDLFTVTLVNKEKRIVQFTWNDPDTNFAELIQSCGEVPLPPYLNRKPTEEDRPRYQTVYSKKEGAVAAPTAGLHFTEKLMGELAKSGFSSEYLTLHVSAGTFQPIKEEEIEKHQMHKEQISIPRSTIEKLYQTNGNVVAVGTTSMRSLESLYWFGVQLIESVGEVFSISKLFPYEHHPICPNKKESMEAVLDFMLKNDLEELTGDTEIFIFPKYKFKICNGLITNFHQPGSTLILLVAAFSKGRWREIYDSALSHNYRFLSYGDSNLIWNQRI